MRRGFAAPRRSRLENAGSRARRRRRIAFAALATVAGALLALGRAHADAKPPTSFSDLHWRSVGPLRGG